LERGLAAVDAELTENPFDVCIHGGGLGAHAVRNFFVGEVGSEEGYYLMLAPGEAKGGIARPERPGVVSEEGEGVRAKCGQAEAGVGEGARQPFVNEGLENAAGSTNAEAVDDAVEIQLFGEEHDGEPGKEVPEPGNAFDGGGPRGREVEEHDARRRREGGTAAGKAPNSAERFGGQVERYAPGGFGRLEGCADGGMQVLVLSDEQYGQIRSR
jgi:hypothetical protein